MHVQEAVAEDLLDAGSSRSPRTAARTRWPTSSTRAPMGAVASIRASARSASAAVRPAMIPSRTTAARVRSSCSVVALSVTRTCRTAPSRNDDDQAGEAVRDRDDVDPADVGGPGLGRGHDRGGPVGRGEDRRREAEPLLAGVLDLAELVADHQLLDRRQRSRCRRSTRRSSGSPRRSGRGRRTCAGASAARPPRGPTRMFRTVALDTPRR